MIGWSYFFSQKAYNVMICDLISVYVVIFSLSILPWECGIILGTSEGNISLPYFKRNYRKNNWSKLFITSFLSGSGNKVK